MEFGEPKSYVSIGEFARLSGICRKTLIFYDEIGLFSPEIVAENGYRYYSHHQIDTATVIFALREIGMPLKEIKIYLDQRSPEMLVTLFSKQKKRVDREIKKLRQISRMMESRIAMTRESCKVQEREIFLQESEGIPILLSAPVSGSFDWDPLLEFYDYCAENGVVSGYPVGAVVPMDRILQGDFHLRSHFFVRLDRRQQVPAPLSSLRPPGLYAVGYIRGVYGSAAPLYRRMAEFIQGNNLEICGDGYEEALQDEIAQKNPEEYLFQVSIQVKHSR